MDSTLAQYLSRPTAKGSQVGILWCPLETAWGNAADWATVAVSLMVGVAVGLMTRRTNALAEAANRTADAAWAAQGAAEAADAALREREQILILISLSTAIGLAVANINALKQMLDIQGWPRRLQTEANLQSLFLERMEAARFTVPESVRDRLHYLDLDIAGRIMRGEAAIPLLAASISHLGSCTPEVAADAVRTYHAALGEYVSELSVALAACQRASSAAGLGVARPTETAA